MDLYPTGSSLFLTATAVSARAAHLSWGNPMLRAVTMMATMYIGSLYSSPEDIREAARKSREMAEKVDVALASIKTEVKNLDGESWEKFGRPQMEEAVAKFEAEGADSKEVFKGLADLLDELAKNSFQLAVSSAVAAGILLGLAIASKAGKLTPPPISLATDLAAAGTGAAILAKLGTLLTSTKAVYGAGATIAAIGSSILGMHAQSSMRSITTPQGDAMPQFETVYIPGLPQYDSKGKPLGDNAFKA